MGCDTLDIPLTLVYNEEKNKLFMRCKMDFISESIETRVAHECDVLVVGGGFAGIAAALSAARE